MLPQGLLFSSDQQVAELILALLPEFGIEVEHRPDVFSAIEKLTGRSYDLLVVDWKDPLEASFLLKTARELSMARATPAIAIVDQKDSSAALNLGASGVLIRPFSYEQARSTFEACLTGRSSERRYPVQTTSRQVPSPTKSILVAAPPSSKRDRASVAPAAPERSARPMTASLPTFAGYAQTTGAKPSKKFIKSVPVILAVIGLGLAGSQYRQIEARLSAVHWLSPFRSTATVGLSNQDATGLEQPPIAFENPRLGIASDYSAEMADTRSPSSGRSKVAPRTSPALRAAEGSDAAALRLMEPDARLVRPDVPGSLMVSLQAMTGRPAETKLSQQQASRWSLEPILLPEDNARQLLLRQIQPKYPEFAVATGLEGVVTLHAFIDKEGIIRDLKLIRGSLLLGRSAFDAVKQWRYKPYRVNGEAVEMQTFITVSFVRSSHAALAQKLP